MGNRLCTFEGRRTLILFEVMPPKASKAKAVSQKEKTPPPALNESGDQSLLEKKGKGRGRPSGSVDKKKKKVVDRQYKRYLGKERQRSWPSFWIRRQKEKKGRGSSIQALCWNRFASSPSWYGNVQGSQSNHELVSSGLLRKDC